jgi:hypothetical protein
VNAWRALWRRAPDAARVLTPIGRAFPLFAGSDRARDIGERRELGFALVWLRFPVRPVLVEHKGRYVVLTGPSCSARLHA